MYAARNVISLLRKHLSPCSSGLTKGFSFPSAFRKPQLIHKPDSNLSNFLLKNCPVISKTYRPTIWCYGGRAQTVITQILKRCAPIECHRELVQLEDGGEIALDWLDNGSEKAENPATHPTVLILPGLAGTSRQTTILHFVKQFAQNGYRVVVMNDRGTAGVRLKTPKAFCVANTDDLKFVISHIHYICPGISLLAVGVCMGGITLINYLARTGSQGNNTGLVGALTISVLWNLGKTLKTLEKPINHFFFNRHLAKYTENLIRRNRAMLEDNSVVLKEETINNLLRYTSLCDFANTFATPICGFQNVDEYYKAAALYNKPLEAINIPLVCLNSTDDPFVPKDTIPYNLIQTCPNVVLALTTHGGHIAFSEGLVPTGPGYADKFAGQYAKAIFEHGAEIERTQLSNFEW